MASTINLCLPQLYLRTSSLFHRSRKDFIKANESMGWRVRESLLGVLASAANHTQQKHEGSKDSHFVCLVAVQQTINSPVTSGFAASRPGTADLGSVGGDGRVGSIIVFIIAEHEQSFVLLPTQQHILHQQGNTQDLPISHMTAWKRMSYQDSNYGLPVFAMCGEGSFIIM